MEADPVGICGAANPCIEREFASPIQQNYGLNKLGIVASKYPEGGRYYVHSEFYYVDIINRQGQPFKPGETGRLLVTSLSNPAMPLIRYDTDDMATATDQLCECGRTLACFGEILGRYSRIAFLPQGTLALVGIIRDILANLPAQLSCGLRRFQIHQNNQQQLQLRLAASLNLTQPCSGISKTVGRPLNPKAQRALMLYKWRS